MRAFSALLNKELRALLPVFLLGAFLISGDLLSRPFTERLDEATYTSVASIEPGEGTFIGFFQFLIGFVVAYAALGREHDERTIEFLYALPTSRPRIFLAKVLAGLTVVWAVAYLGQVTNWILVAPNPSSFAQTELRWDLALRISFLHAITATVGYGHGLFASFFRRFGVLPYVFLGFGLGVLIELVPTVDWLDPLRLARTEYVGTAVQIPWLAVVFQLAVALTAIALAYVLWMGSFDRLRSALTERSLGATLVFGGGITAAVVVAFGVSIFFAVRQFGDEPPPDPDAPVEPTEVPYGAATAHTAHYAFVYPENFAASAATLVGRSDRILEAAAHTLGEEALPSITVDLAEVSSHHEGIAASSRIRMGLVDQPDFRLAHVLAHESTHVLQNQASQNRAGEYGGTTRFFIEGSAEWVAFRIAGDPALALTSAPERAREAELFATSRLLAALAVERHGIRFEELLDDAGFRARYDTVLAYPLGEVLTESIARACGPSAVGDTLRAFARPEMPQDATGEILMRDVLGSFGCDLEQVVAAWDATLAEITARERARMDAVPRMILEEVRAEGTTVVLVVRLDRAPLPLDRFYVRTRRNVMTEDTEVRSSLGDRDGDRVTFRLSGESLPAATGNGPHTFEVLLSQELDEQAFPHSERWQSVTVR